MLAVSAVDEHILLINLSGPTPYFLGLLNSASTYPMHSASVEKHGSAFSRPGNLISNGAYVLKSWDLRSRIELVKNTHYWDADQVLLAGVNVAGAIRQEDIGNLASKIAAIAPVRAALLDRQRAFRIAPGLVADGRDMGTVIFPEAKYKVFLTASAEQRAERRHKQLISKGMPAKIDSLLEDLLARDLRDTSRTHAPLKPAEDALQLDNSSLSIEESVQQVLNWWQSRTAFSGF